MASLVCGSSRMSFRIAARRLLFSSRVCNRCLLTDSTLGLDEFDRQRSSTFNGQEQRLPSSVRTDQQNLLNITANDTNFVRSIESQSIVTVRKEDGTDVTALQLLHRQKRTDDAFELMTTNWSPAVDSLVCYQVAMDLLFESGRYSQVADVWHKFTSDSRLVQKLPYPRSMTILLAASCYKLNSADSYGLLLSIIEDMLASKKIVHPRVLAFAAASAMNQAREILELVVMESNEQPNTLIQSLKVAVLTKLRRFDDAMAAINVLLEIDQPAQTWSRGHISNDVLDDFCTALRANNEFTQLKTFRNVQKAITASDRRISKSIEQLLLVPVAMDTSADVPQIHLHSSPDQSVSVRSNSDNSLGPVGDPQLEAYKTALRKRIVKRIMEHGPLHVENYRR